MNYAYDRQKNERRGRRFGLFGFLMLLATIFFGALLALAFFAPWIDPNKAWVFAFLGLSWPILYIVNIALALYWVVRWRKYAFIPILPLVLGFGAVSLFFRPSLTKHYDGQREGKPAFTVMSYNVEGFLDSYGRKLPMMDSTAAFIAGTGSEIVCMQEFQTTDVMPLDKIDGILSELPYKALHYSLTSRGNGWGVAIYSKYRIVASSPIDLKAAGNTAMMADVAVGEDTLRIFNCHLQSTRLSSAERQFMTPEEFLQNDNAQKKEKAKSIIRKLRENYCLRAAQADTIALLASQSPHPVIICGDFNDTPMSYVYRTIRGGRADAFEEKGRGSSNTYRGFYNLFRIDYIVYDKALRAATYQSPSTAISDHYPVIAGFDFCE